MCHKYLESFCSDPQWLGWDITSNCSLLLCLNPNLPTIHGLFVDNKPEPETTVLKLVCKLQLVLTVDWCCVNSETIDKPQLRWLLCLKRLQHCRDGKQLMKLSAEQTREIKTMLCLLCLEVQTLLCLLNQSYWKPVSLNIRIQSKSKCAWHTQ